MIEYKNGIHLKGTELWFDSKRKVPLSFISSAEIEKFTPPEKILATPETIKFLEKKIKKPVVLPCPYFRPFALGSLQVELVPSGTMLGSSQIIVNKGDKTLLYSGDINLGNLPTTQPAYTKHCDVLVLKCPFGQPEYKFPKFDDVLKKLVDFVNETLLSKMTPVLAVDPLGIAQDIILALGQNGFKLSLHKTIYKFTKVYEELGVGFEDYDLYKPKEKEGAVIFIPHAEIYSKDLADIKSKKVTFISEFTEEENPMVKSELHVDELINMSSKADFDDLIEFVDLVEPGKVYLVEENANQFAQVLQERGYNAISLEDPTQLNLL